MKFISLFLLTFILFFSGCNNEKPLQQQLHKESNTQLKQPVSELVVDLNQFTTFVIELIKTNDIAKILGEGAQNSQEMITALIKNFSPAEIAFEAEVLNYEKPVTLLFYDKNNEQAQTMNLVFNALATQNSNKSKFVTINVTELFKLADQAAINVVPTLMVIYNKIEIGRVENPLPAMLDTELTLLLQKIDSTTPQQF